MKVEEIRKVFLDFFISKGHYGQPSSSLIPTDDPTLLFTNAGMVQFKDYFLGVSQPKHKRVTTSQRCLRAGGKHNDLENVGYTARHHTFFEMLGNFSFGDYFKKEAIEYAWTFLTEVLQIPKDKLWVTVYHDDQESKEIWLQDIGVPQTRLSMCDEKDNFWSMGDSGPCGPCSEIFFDHGPDIPGGPPGSATAEGDRFVEIWNMVFMQYNRVNGKLEPLPQACVDTGMGLERIAAVMQQVHSNYDIDLFTRLMTPIGQVMGCSDLTNKSLRVIADHLRACSFLVLDGVKPSNEGRGYVLRRIMRRALRHGNLLGMEQPFFHRLVTFLIDVMGQAYPSLKTQQQQIEKVFLAEEQQFAKTLHLGLKILEEEISSLTTKELPGEIAFRLYDTYGFPFDLTADILREKDLTIDVAGFETAMAAQRTRARSQQHFKSAHIPTTTIPRFTGYEKTADTGKIIELFVDQKPVQTLTPGSSGVVVLQQTPFYAEAGGQIGDTGTLVTATGEFIVLDTQKQNQTILHHGMLQTGHISIGDACRATVSAKKRQQIQLNHSATHLLHAALRKVLGPHVTQKGSLVTAERLRFDFSHDHPLTQADIETVTLLVHQHIRANHSIGTDTMSLKEAQTIGAMALFGEKYEEPVRVLKMGDFSVELCGGTHAKNTGDLAGFRIILETSVAAGVRRIEAITGEAACLAMLHQQHIVASLTQSLNVAEEDLSAKIETLIQQNKTLLKKISTLEKKNHAATCDELIQQAIVIQDLQLIIGRFVEYSPAALRDIIDRLKTREKTVVLLCSTQKNKVALSAAVSKDLLERLQAGTLLNFVAQQLGGKGGGRPDLAQGGASDISNLEQVLSGVATWVAEQL